MDQYDSPKVMTEYTLAENVIYFIKFFAASFLFYFFSTITIIKFESYLPFINTEFAHSSIVYILYLLAPMVFLIKKAVNSNLQGVKGLIILSLSLIVIPAVLSYLNALAFLGIFNIGMLFSGVHDL